MSGLSYRLALRVGALALSIALAMYFLVTFTYLGVAIIMLFVIIFQVYEMHYFITQTNRNITNFLESVKYSDFISGLSSGNKLGKSYRELNRSINDVMEAFRKARADTEEHHQYLRTVVEHVNTGLISYDQEGNIGLINVSAKKIIEKENLKNIEDIIAINSRLYKAIFDLPVGKSTLFTNSENEQVALHATEIILRGKVFKLIAIHNIQTELQKKEIEAWQNLTKVLRHEIMNSIAPIASLTSTLKDIIREDLVQENEHYKLDNNTVEDLSEGLNTIEVRSKGLITFIEAYRDYTSIPSPNITKVPARDLFAEVIKLLNADIKGFSIKIFIDIKPRDLILEVDRELIGQVLINIAKNAIEAMEQSAERRLSFSAGVVEGTPILKIKDSGPGIIREALSKIFIPFYSTKNRGSGIGLALSRQIMQLHNGTITVKSEINKMTEFTLRF